jgi:uncharacterized membrane-anchored protein
MDRSVDVSVAVGTTVGSVGLLSVSRCWRKKASRSCSVCEVEARLVSGRVKLWADRRRK